MIVKPRRKMRPLNSDELRVIHIGADAVEEVLWEHLMENGASYFDVDENDDSVIFTMEWDRSTGALIYGALPLAYAVENGELDFAYIRKQTGVTAQSLYQPDRYRRMHLNSHCLKKR